ncbi:MAG: HlyD family efflux transporter periplasmic adaptor subunit [Propionibacteriaceae bacterium]|nr:HlyD family efflux transporter periplasmic adaptor subunit [Propionibacteriaceae bacterium]
MPDNAEHADLNHSEKSAKVPTKRRRRFLRWLIPVVAVVVVAGVAGGILLSHRAAASTTVTTVTRDVQASMVTMTESVTTSGTIEPQQQADLSFSSSGTVNTVSVAVGDTVVTGQALASIDTTSLQSSVDSAQAAVDAAQSDYNTAVSSGVSAQITAANSTLATKQNALTNAQSALSAGTLTAPFDGTVAVVSMAVGDSVGSGGSGNSGSGNSGSGGNSGLGSSSSSSSDVITVITTNLYSVSTSVGASDVTKISKGMAVQVTPNSSSDQLAGTVTSVGVIASSSTSSGASFPVTINITDPQQGLYAGVTASVDITTSSRQVLAVPSAAISLDQGQSTVQLKTDQAVTTTNVTTGESSNSMTEITAGLQEGDTVEVTMRTGGNAANNPGGLSSLFPGGNGTRRPQGNFTFQPGSGAGGGGYPGQGGGYGGGGYGGGGAPGGAATGGR